MVAGDRGAIDALVREWLPVTLQWCRRLGGPSVDPEHAAQEVFLVVLRKVEQVTDPACFPAWLYGITRRVLAQHRRKGWVKNRAHGKQPELIDPSPSPAARTHRARQVSGVHGILVQMPDQLREVLVLCDVEERTDPEAADLIGIPLGTVKSRLRRARFLFRELAVQKGLAMERWSA